MVEGLLTIFNSESMSQDVHVRIAGPAINLKDDTRTINQERKGGLSDGRGGI